MLKLLLNLRNSECYIKCVKIQCSRPGLGLALIRHTFACKNNWNTCIHYCSTCGLLEDKISPERRTHPLSPTRPYLTLRGGHSACCRLPTSQPEAEMEKTLRLPWEKTLSRSPMIIILSGDMGEAGRSLCGSVTRLLLPHPARCCASHSAKLPKLHGARNWGDWSSRDFCCPIYFSRMPSVIDSLRNVDPEKKFAARGGVAAPQLCSRSGVERGAQRLRVAHLCHRRNLIGSREDWTCPWGCWNASCEGAAGFSHQHDGQRQVHMKTRLWNYHSLIHSICCFSSFIVF